MQSLIKELQSRANSVAMAAAVGDIRPKNTCDGEKLSKKYEFYLRNVKKNSLVLKKILEKDPLRKYIT